MTIGTIHTHGKEWKCAMVIGEIGRMYTNGKRVILAAHHGLPELMEFWYETRDGKHYSVVNDVFWLVLDGEEDE